MKTYDQTERPSKAVQESAMESYSALEAILGELKPQGEQVEIEIEETQEKIKVPLMALKMLAHILKVTGEGQPISIVPVAAEITTQAAAEMIGCSRPHLVKLLEEGEIPFTKVGKHRRIKYEDLMAYKKKMKEKQRNLLIELMKSDEEPGLYGS